MRGLAAHFGVNDYCRKLDTDSECPDLISAAFDAQGLATLSSARGFTLFLGRARVDGEVKPKSLTAAIDTARTTLVAGDYFIITFDGYGFHKGGKRGWKLFRGGLGFDVLIRMLQSIPSGVRILVVSSACYSGTVDDEGPVTPSIRGIRRDLDMSPLQPADSSFRHIRIDDSEGESEERAEAAVYLMDVGELEKMNQELPKNEPSIAVVNACGATQTILDGLNAKTHSPFIERFLMLASGPQLTLTTFERAIQAVSPATAMPFIERDPNPGFSAAFEAAGVFRLV